MPNQNQASAIAISLSNDELLEEYYQVVRMKDKTEATSFSNINFEEWEKILLRVIAERKLHIK